MIITQKLIEGKLYKTKKLAYMFFKNKEQQYETKLVEKGIILLLLRSPSEYAGELRGGLWLLDNRFLYNSVDTVINSESYFQFLENQDG